MKPNFKEEHHNSKNKLRSWKISTPESKQSYKNEP